jgi:hypothetical protein
VAIVGGVNKASSLLKAASTSPSPQPVMVSKSMLEIALENITFKVKKNFLQKDSILNFSYSAF